MGWFDDLKTRAEQSFDNFGSDIGDYIKNRLTDAAVKVGEPAKGNQSEAQIAAGQAGGQPPMAASSQMDVNSQLMKYLPLIAVVGIMALVLKRGK